MDDQKPLLEELRQIKERLGRIESNTSAGLELSRPRE